MKPIKILNIILIVFSLFLAANLVQPLDNIAGNLAYRLDSSEPTCFFSNKGIQSEVPVEMCCYEIQKQLECKPGQDGFKCYTAEDSGMFYLVNSKEMSLCREEDFDVRTK